MTDYATLLKNGENLRKNLIDEIAAIEIYDSVQVIDFLLILYIL